MCMQEDNTCSYVHRNASYDPPSQQFIVKLLINVNKKKCVCVLFQTLCFPKNLLFCSKSKNFLPTVITLFPTLLPSIFLPKNLLKCCYLVSRLVFSLPKTCYHVSIPSLFLSFQPSQMLLFCFQLFLFCFLMQHISYPTSKLLPLFQPPSTLELYYTKEASGLTHQL